MLKQDKRGRRVMSWKACNIVSCIHFFRTLVIDLSGKNIKGISNWQTSDSKLFIFFLQHLIDRIGVIKFAFESVDVELRVVALMMISHLHKNYVFEGAFGHAWLNLLHWYSHIFYFAMLIRLLFYCAKVQRCTKWQLGRSVASSASNATRIIEQKSTLLARIAFEAARTGRSSIPNIHTPCLSIPEGHAS